MFIIYMLSDKIFRKTIRKIMNTKVMNIKLNWRSDKKPKGKQSFLTISYLSTSRSVEL